MHAVSVKPRQLQSRYAGDPPLALLKGIVDRVLSYTGLDTPQPRLSFLWTSSLQTVELVVP